MTKLFKLTLFLSFVLFCIPAHGEVKRFLAGNAADVNPTLHGPAYHFQGGGTDVDAAFQWMIDQVRGCTDCDTKLDVVVLRASGDDDYNPYLLAMHGVDSVETLIITSPEDSKQPDVVETVRNAEIIFFAGGDQCDYVKDIKGTPLQTAVESVNARGGGISGTSAGLAMQGDFIYDACTGSTRSFEGLGNPYHESISFTDNFFHWANMQQTITEQHLVERDRMGRTLAFLARQIRDGKTKSVLSVAVDRETSLGVDKNGLALVMGKGPAYFILADHAPEVCEPNKPLTYSNYKIWKRDAGETFDLKHRPQAGFYLRSVKNGVVDADVYAEFPCEPSTEVANALAQVEKSSPASIRTEYESLMKRYPENVFIERGYQDWSQGKDAAKLIDHYKHILKKHPGDSKTLYLYGSILARENQTEEAIENLQKAVASDPQFGLPHLEIASLSKDPAQIKQNLQDTIRLCPRDFAPYRYLTGTNDADFIKAKAAELRRFLNNTTEPHLLLTFSSLWALEFKIHPEAEYPDLRKQIAEDLKWLSEEKDFRSLEALRMLKQGYEYVPDPTAAKAIDDEIHSRFPSAK